MLLVTGLTPYRCACSEMYALCVPFMVGRSTLQRIQRMQPEKAEAVLGTFSFDTSRSVQLTRSMGQESCQLDAKNCYVSSDGCEWTDLGCRFAIQQVPGQSGLRCFCDAELHNTHQSRSFPSICADLENSDASPRRDRYIRRGADCAVNLPRLDRRHTYIRSQGRCHVLSLCDQPAAEGVNIAGLEVPCV